MESIQADVERKAGGTPAFAPGLTSSRKIEGEMGKGVRPATAAVTGRLEWSTAALLHTVILHTLALSASECVIAVEGRGISTLNAGQISPLPLTSQPPRVHIYRTTSISLSLQCRACNMDYYLQACHVLHNLSRSKCLHHHRAPNH